MDLGRNLDMGLPEATPVEHKKDYPTVTFPMETELRVGTMIEFIATGTIKRIEEDEQNGRTVTLELKDGEVKDKRAKTPDEAINRANDLRNEENKGRQ